MKREDLLKLLKETKAKEKFNVLHTATGSKNYHLGRAKLCDTLIEMIEELWPEKTEEPEKTEDTKDLGKRLRHMDKNLDKMVPGFNQYGYPNR